MPTLTEKARRAAQRVRDLARPRRRDWEKRAPHEAGRRPRASLAPAPEPAVPAGIQFLANAVIQPGVYINVSWPQWNNSYTASSSTITVTNQTIWTNWHECGTGTATVTDYVQTWTTWADTVGNVRKAYGQPVRQETEAECRLRQEQTRRWQEEQKARYEKEERERRMSRARARKLLVEHLNPQQREDYERRGFFHLYTNNGRKYRIHQGTHGNVKLIDVTTDKELGYYCSQPSGVPDEDAMLAQKFWLEMDEDEFIAKANFRPTLAPVGLLDARGRPIEQRRAA